MEYLVIILLIVGVLAAINIMRSKNSAKAGGSTQEAPRHTRYKPDDLRIENMKPGGFYALRAYGPDMSDLDVQVTARHLYDEHGYKWHEIEGESEIGRVWLTVIEDDDTEMTVTLRKFSLAQLGISRKKLERIDDQEEGEVTFEGKRYLYEDSGDCNFYRDGDRNRRENFYYWDFESTDGSACITVERWGGDGGDFEVHLSQPISESQITVYSLRGDA